MNQARICDVFIKPQMAQMTRMKIKKTSAAPGLKGLLFHQNNQMKTQMYASICNCLPDIKRRKMLWHVHLTVKSLLKF